MTDTQILSQLKFRIASLQSNLSQKQKIIDQYKCIQNQADSKIKGLQKIHAQKIKSLLNSIQILKKQKASIEGLSKQHKRSKLIQQLNKQILDQDLAIEVLRKYVYEKEGKQQGRKICDDVIVKALKKGPERIRPLTRQQLRMQIDKLKEININLEKKIKQGTHNKKGGVHNGGIVNGFHDYSLSQVSSVMSQDSTINNRQSSSQQILQKLRSLQLQTQTLKLESNSKTKIIQKLKIQLKQSQKLKSQFQLIKNQLDISNRKVFTYEKLLKQNKESTNKKIIDLYERQLKVQELQVISKQNNDKLKSLSENHNILIQQLQVEKEQLQTKYDEVKAENERLIFDNISNKKHQQNQKAKIDEIREINQRQKSELSEKLKEYETQVTRILDQNQKLKKAYHEIQNKLFTERGQWVEEKQKYIQELNQLRENKSQAEKVANLMIQIDQLKEQNKKLQKIFGPSNITAEGSHGDDKLLLERLQNYRRKLQYYQTLLKKDPSLKTKQVQLYNQLFENYDKTLKQFMQYKRKVPSSSNQVHSTKAKHPRKAIIQLTNKQKAEYQNFSSGIDSLNLGEVDSEVLDNFNTSYEYSIHVNEYGEEIKMPKISQADKELLKLINSDLWYFIKDDQLTKKIEEASSLNEEQEEQKAYISQQMRKIRNLSHPQGQKVTLFEEQLKNLENISDSVSITSAMEKEINNYDSDVNVQMKKLIKDAPAHLNFEQMKNMSLQIGSDIQVSSVESGDSNVRKKKKTTQKASKIKFVSKGSIHSSQIDSEISEDMLNSDVSSINISQHALNKIDSDVEADFRKKRK